MSLTSPLASVMSAARNVTRGESSLHIELPDLRLLLLSIVIVRMVITLWDMIYPVLQMCFCSFYQEQTQRVAGAAKALAGAEGGASAFSWVADPISRLVVMATTSR